MGAHRGHYGSIGLGHSRLRRVNTGTLLIALGGPSLNHQLENWQRSQLYRSNFVRHIVTLQNLKSV
jgi:hypothetical protein